jgi:uncharacterized protein with ParB-like and HNH nuclease domain
MKAEERKISQILTQAICYQIPSYQRPYSWDTENVTQLLEDIETAYQTEETEYFIGSLITIEQVKDELYDVVDGQQRITTLSIILARLRDHINSHHAKGILESHIVHNQGLMRTESTPRLSLRSKDQPFFVKYILESQEFDMDKFKKLESPQRNIIQNARVVDEFFANKDEQNLVEFANFILTQVYIVFVTTSSFKSAYRLFNVLNARGLPLSNADLIKNSLFSRLQNHATQSDELEQNWLNLENTITIEQLDPFFRHYRNAITGIRAKSGLHEEIEALLDAKDKPINPLAFLDNATNSAEQYQRIRQADFEDSQTLRALHSLHRVNYDEWIPALLCFLTYKVDGLSEKDFIILLEKITIQNWVRRLGRAARFTIYYRLIRAILDHKGADEIRAIFSNEAKNDEFIQLLQSDVYTQPFAKAVLLRLEEGDKDESVIKLYKGLITIEHILPQSIKEPYWSERFTEEKHQEWVHKLGNLTLLAGRKNYAAQAKPFCEKKKRYSKKLDKVSFDMTKKVCKNADWELNELEERQTKMIDLAKLIWLIP